MEVRRPMYHAELRIEIIVITDGILVCEVSGFSSTGLDIVICLKEVVQELSGIESLTVVKKVLNLEARGSRFVKLY
jgi:hypothetical protein